MPTNSELNQITNFVPISDHLSTAGQPTIEQFKAIAAAGYDTIINLALKTSTNAIENEAEIIADLEMEYVHIPVEWENPAMADLEYFFEVMAAHQDEKVLVHCALNMRVSAFTYLYRTLKQGVEPQVAQQDLNKVWEPIPTWQSFIDRAIAHYS
ncbi:Beta-lactamase hydrolase-family protein [Thalassoporum mexicanum PCC 7367]|uniref:protein tyrosine phosphatase family protein n=1 Tax=Thalassoporum mexicanum TaxID=3457544 RepID=UPI00029F9781|nr:protein tyrosine phosphatase family protein [Pseudanabaena sp. PCC 7367]AFY71614.1 Beta-lactamase hydrolase-family protein [Pseudanabaena sp. PCC 7367]